MTRREAAPYTPRMARTRKPESSEPSPVRLKPILGVKPESYLPVLLGLGLLVLLFLLLVYPGLRAYGTEVTFRSSPAGAEVIVDGVRLGATPVTSFVEAGEHTLILRYPGFREKERGITTSGRLLGSLFSKRKQVISTTLDPTAPGELAARRAEDFARWALGGAGNAAFQVPPILAETARALGAFSDDPDTFEAGRELLRSGRYHLATSTQLKDLLRGTLLFNGAGGPTPLGLSRSVLELIQPAKDSQSAAAMQLILDRTLPEALRGGFRAGGWYDSERELSSPPVASSGSGTLPSTIAVEGMTFRRIEAGESSFLMLDREVSRERYATFLLDRPVWRPENRQELLAAGSATEDYLADWGSPISSGEPVRFVSWFAADAFARWLTTRLHATNPAYRDRLEARLPREAEWRVAAALEGAPGSDVSAPARITFESDGERPYPATAARRSDAGFYDLYGNLWEWSGDWYTPSPEASELEQPPAPPIAGAERVVQGGSFANSERDLTGDLRGSQPPRWCSPYLGFRVVIAPVQEEI